MNAFKIHNFGVGSSIWSVFERNMFLQRELLTRNIWFEGPWSFNNLDYQIAYLITFDGASPGVHLMMQLLTRSKNDGILCPILSTLLTLLLSPFIVALLFIIILMKQ
ncbi:unnamed protein product [Lactuca virosa]|uniref:Uncharacterized protein n=1 Tax=Lactuca virosa TaxID=75947 RepID=A0AAU9MW60_9ASTR|nr:unnamed protein product [Lactuca virosa]